MILKDLWMRPNLRLGSAVGTPMKMRKERRKMDLKTQSLKMSESYSLPLKRKTNKLEMMKRLLKMEREITTADRKTLRPKMIDSYFHHLKWKMNRLKRMGTTKKICLVKMH